MSRNTPRACGASTSVMVSKDVSDRVRQIQATRTIERTMRDLQISDHTLQTLRTCGRLTEKTIARVVAKLDELEAATVQP